MKIALNRNAPGSSWRGPQMRVDTPLLWHYVLGRFAAPQVGPPQMLFYGLLTEKGGL